MSTPAVGLTPSSRTSIASEEERKAEQLPGVASAAARVGRRRWLAQNNDWCGKCALIPAHICCHILNVYSWVAGIFGVISGAIFLVHDPASVVTDPYYWAFVAMSGLQLLIALLRG